MSGEVSQHVSVLYLCVCIFCTGLVCVQVGCVTFVQQRRILRYCTCAILLHVTRHKGVI